MPSRTKSAQSAEQPTAVSSETAPTSPGPMRRVATASFIGTAIEYYDFYIYGTAAALVFNEVFFSNLSSINGVLASFSTYAVAFIARPLGSALFGHFGDRVGRKSVLVLSLLLMGLSTAAVGFLPSYETWGMWSPVLLVVLRVVQGIGLGGEWGGAALLAVEHAPAGRRGRYAAYPQLGPAAGLFAATGTFLLLSTQVSDDAFQAWAWRIPFMLSLFLVAVGLFVRLKISETPVFAQAAGDRKKSSAPLLVLVRSYPRELLLGCGSMVAAYCMFYATTTYCLAYGTKSLGISRPTMLLASMAAAVFFGLGTWFAANRSDTQGRRRTALIGTGGTAVWGLLLFPLLDTGRLPLIILALGGSLLIMGVIYGPMGAFLPELFPTEVRYSGASLANSLGGVLGGAIPPLVSTPLQSAFGAASIGWYASVMALITFGCVLALPETRQRRLTER